MNDTAAVQQEYTSVLDTPEVAVPARTPQAHQGEVTSVQIHETQSGSQQVEIGLISLNTAEETNFRFFVPDTFIDYLNSGGQPNQFDTSTLPEEEGNNQLATYRRHISNGDKTATLQSLLQMAINQGRGSLLDNAGAITDFQSYVDLYNTVLSGTKLIYRKRESKNEATGQKFFNVTGYFNKLEDADNPKMFRGNVRKMWTDQ